MTGVDTRSAAASCCRTSALGFRSPRSIWLRYGLETPACSASWRSEMRALCRRSRMNSPMSCGSSRGIAMSRTLRRSANYCKQTLATVTPVTLPEPGHRSHHSDRMPTTEYRGLSHVFDSRHVYAEQSERADGHGYPSTHRAIVDLDRHGAGTGYRDGQYAFRAAL